MLDHTKGAVLLPRACRRFVFPCEPKKMVYLGLNSGLEHNTKSAEVLTGLHGQQMNEIKITKGMNRLLLSFESVVSTANPQKLVL
jgi:hypothetical protein